MNNLIFGDEQIIEQVYKGKQNLIKKAKKEKKVDKINFDDYRDFMLKKGRIKIVNGQTIYQLDKLIEKKYNKSGKYIGDGNINDKEILKYYKENLKLKQKYLKLLKELENQNKIYFEKNSDFIKSKISKIENELFILKSKIIF